MDMNSQEYLDIKAEIKAKLDMYIEEDLMNKHEDKVKRFPKWLYSIPVMAAAIISVVMLLPEKEEPAAPVKWTECIAAYGEKKSVILEDGTKLWLHNDSRIIFPDKFTGDTRQVFVSGEVYAEVAKDPDRPFVLSSNNVNILVKGTTFNYRSYPESPEVELTLLEGAVEMDMNISNTEKTLIVSPGQIIKADLKDGDISRLSFSPETYESWKDGHAIYFNDESLALIVAELQRQFSIKIIVEDPSLLKLRYYASFINCTDPVEILTSLNSANNRKRIIVDEIDGTYYINSK